MAEKIYLHVTFALNNRGYATFVARPVYYTQDNEMRPFPGADSVAPDRGAPALPAGWDFHGLAVLGYAHGRSEHCEAEAGDCHYYGYEAAYRNITVTTARATRMARTLQDIEGRMDRLSGTLGTPRGAGEYTRRFAAAIGAAGVKYCEQCCALGHMPLGHHDHTWTTASTARIPALIEDHEAQWAQSQS